MNLFCAAQVMTDADAEYIPKHVLLAELEEINRKQSEMELHGRMMYEKLRAGKRLFHLHLTTVCILSANLRVELNFSGRKIGR
jgi:hypothetical protein